MPLMFSESNDFQKRKRYIFKEGDWACPNQDCKNINFSRRTKCNRCGAPKPANLYDNRQKRYSTTGTYRSRSRSRSKHSKHHHHSSKYDKNYRSRSNSRENMNNQVQRKPFFGPSGIFKEGDWRCENCQNINFKWRNQCNKCGCPKRDVGNNIIHNIRNDRDYYNNNNNDRRRDYGYYHNNNANGYPYQNVGRYRGGYNNGYGYNNNYGRDRRDRDRGSRNDKKRSSKRRKSSSSSSSSRRRSSSSSSSSRRDKSKSSSSSSSYNSKSSRSSKSDNSDNSNKSQSKSKSKSNSKDSKSGGSHSK